MGKGDDACDAAVRAWLRDVVGIGGTYTYVDLRAGVPGFSQTDRRMRELRYADPPWTITWRATDPTLPRGVFRLDGIGGDYVPPRPSDRVRREVFEAANNRCQVCGIGANEYYENSTDVARLQLGHWVPKEHGGSLTDRGNLRCECHRCNEGIKNRTGAYVPTASVIARAKALKKSDKQSLYDWLRQDRRAVSDAERLFYESLQLPPSAREELMAELRAHLGHA